MKAAFESLTLLIAVALVVFVIAGTSSLSQDAQAILMTLVVIGLFTAPVLALFVIAWAYRAKYEQPKQITTVTPRQLPHHARPSLPAPHREGQIVIVQEPDAYYDEVHR